MIKHCIYKITSPTGRVYIGQTRNFKDRMKRYAGSRTAGQHKILRSIIKHGWAAHKVEVAHIFSSEVTQDTLDYWEVYYWQECKDNDIDTMNIKYPGSNGLLSEETKRKIGNKMKGRVYSKLWRKRISDGGKGRVASEETRARLSKATIGKKKSAEHAANISKAQLGVRFSKKRKRILKAAAKNVTPESRAKIKAAQQQSGFNKKLRRYGYIKELVMPNNYTSLTSKMKDKMIKQIIASITKK